MRKEQERKKKLEYQAYLKKQIDEKNKIAEMRKQKEREDDLKYENKIKQELLEEQQKYNAMQNEINAKGKIDPNRESPENIFANPQLQIISSAPNFNNSQNINLNTNTNFDNNFAYQTQPSLYKQPMTPNANVYNMMNAQNNDNNFNRTQPINNYASGNEGYNDELLAKFVSDQMAVIQEYEKKIDQQNDYTENPNEQISVFKALMNEKDLALEKLKIQQENFKAILGFYPMQSDFNNKINSLLDLILKNKIEKIEKIAQQQYNQQQKYNVNYMSSSLTRKNITNTPLPTRKNLNSAMPSNNNNYFRSLDNNLDNEYQINNNYNNNNYINEYNNNQNTNQFNNNNQLQGLVDINLEGCFYRSKYEDLKRSIMLAEDINPEFKTSMVGFSKYVTANDNNQNNKSGFGSSSNFYQTWRDNDNTQQSRLKSIKEEDEHNNNNNNNNTEIKYNISQSKILMSQSYNLDNNEDNDKHNIDNNVTYNNNTNEINTNTSKVKNRISRHLESAKQMRISKEEKDKSLLFVDNNNNTNNITYHSVNNPVLFSSLDAQKQNFCARKSYIHIIIYSSIL